MRTVIISVITAIAFIITSIGIHYVVDVTISGRASTSIKSIHTTIPSGYAYRFMDMALVVQSPFATSRITIEGDGSMRYFATGEGGIEEEGSGQLDQRDVVVLLRFLEQRKVMQSPDAYDDGTGKRDGVTYTLLVRSDPENIHGDAAVASVSCYEYICGDDFLEIVERIRILWGSPILEIGI
ncbi:MAG: hypothetical protein ACPGO5_02975 [Patescibacteria group bacterium]